MDKILEVAYLILGLDVRMLGISNLVEELSHPDIVETRGLIMIPVSVLSDLHIEAGDRVLFVKLAEGHWKLLAEAEDVNDYGAR